MKPLVNSTCLQQRAEQPCATGDRRGFSADDSGLTGINHLRGMLSHPQRGVASEYFGLRARGETGPLV